MRQRSALHGFRLRLFWMGRKARKILPARDFWKLILTHGPFFFMNDLLTKYGTWRHPNGLSVLPAWRRQASATIVLFVGLQMHHFSALPCAWVLSRLFNFEVALAQTPESGNNVTVDTMVRGNEALAKWLNDRPFYALCFSKGTFDALWMTLRWKLNCRHLFSVSAPLRGTKMAFVVDSPGARELRPDSERIQATQGLMSELHAQGLSITLYGAIWDLISPRSNSRLPNKQGYLPPPFLSTILPRLQALLRGRWYRPHDEPWYWCITLPQIGHTAFFNPFVWLLFGTCVLVLERRQAPLLLRHPQLTGGPTGDG